MSPQTLGPFLGTVGLLGLKEAPARPESVRSAQNRCLLGDSYLLVSSQGQWLCGAQWLFPFQLHRRDGDQSQICSAPTTSPTHKVPRVLGDLTSSGSPHSVLPGFVPAGSTPSLTHQSHLPRCSRHSGGGAHSRRQARRGGGALGQALQNRGVQIRCPERAQE